ncbi:ribose 5-phosphate isomerase B [bacterium]|nr:ribose 5-phosphate isomerase B [bacterium]
MKIAIASDHAGFDLKEKIKKFLEDKNIEYQDFGTFSKERVDYPDYGKIVAQVVANNQFERGILICGTGIGMAIVANKIKGIRAACCTSTYLADRSRRHNDANILTLGGRVLSPEAAFEIVTVWLNTPFEGGRHLIRVKKIKELEMNTKKN